MGLPPFFTGENPKDWLRKYDDFCSELRIPNSEKKDWVEPFLIDDAKIWYQNFKKLVSARFSWGEFSENLIWSFGGGANEAPSSNHHSQIMDHMDVDHRVNAPYTPDHSYYTTSANDTHPKARDVKIALGSSNTIHRATSQRRLLRNGCSSPLNIARAGESVGKGKVESNVHLDLTFPTTSTTPLNDIGGRERIDSDHKSLTSMHALTFREHGSQRAHLPHSPELGQFIGHCPASIKLTKRQKQRYASSSNGECSRESFHCRDDGSSGNPQRTYETRSRIHQASPAAEVDVPRGEGGNSDDAASAMAIQTEADEIFARELQEQFHNDVPNVGVGEAEVHVEMGLHQPHGLSAGISRRRNGSNSRRSSIANSSRQQQSTAGSIHSRRGYQSRAPTMNRLTRPRNHGQPRTSLSARQIDSLFSVDVDLDLRLNILEAVVAIDDMGVDNSLLQTQHDFNENQSALDEIIHHRSSSVSHIDSLPQSIVQSDKFEEACVICFDTPVTGDTIRHLPCLHKFHKDCIDPWLRRKPSCPLCNSSIT